MIFNKNKKQETVENPTYLEISAPETTEVEVVPAAPEPQFPPNTVWLAISATEAHYIEAALHAYTPKPLTEWPEWIKVEDLAGYIYGERIRIEDNLPPRLQRDFTNHLG